jgi:hypothetical protein
MQQEVWELSRRQYRHVDQSLSNINLDTPLGKRSVAVAIPKRIRMLILTYLFSVPTPRYMPNKG